MEGCMIKVMETFEVKISFADYDYKMKSLTVM